jgi:hypothetical protein
MSEVKACKQANCPVNKGGECLEGIDLEKDTCTHFYWDNVDDNEVADSEEEPAIPPVTTNRVSLFSGNELTLQEITTVTKKYACDLIIILGDLDCGKTTLLATIFDLLQVGQLKGYMFAGSLTQKGFEIRSHLARIASGADKAETERTKTLEFRVLHLALKSLNGGLIKHLLLSDASGETIRQARSSASLMKKQLEIVRFADHLFYIIDGEKLLVEDRATTMLNTDLFFQNAINNGIFNKQTSINILISKWDKLKNLPGFDMQKMVVDKINDRFSGGLGQIRFSVIASRPDEESVEFDLGYGVEEFLSNFFVPQDKLELIKLNNPGSNREIDNFQMKENE